MLLLIVLLLILFGGGGAYYGHSNYGTIGLLPLLLVVLVRMDDNGRQIQGIEINA